MPEYAYFAVDPEGRERRGRLKAANDAAARANLEAKRFHVVRVEPHVSGATPGKLSLDTPIAFHRNRLSAKQLTLFTRQLATISQVSPLEEALRTISRQSEQPHVRQIVTSVADGVVEGRRLADAMAREPKSFSPLYRAMVSAGESSGSLPELLERLSALLERQAEMRGKILSALAYPIVLTIVAIGVVAALMIAVVPRVVEQFQDVGQQLPLLTRVIIGISAFLAAYWWAILLALALSTVILWRALRDEDFRLAFDRGLLRMPLLGRLIRDLHAARMARTLSTMLESRLPAVEGLRLTAGTISNRALRRATDEIVASIRGGGSISGALARAGVFPPLLVYLAASGESAGRLDAMLAQAADYLEREFDQFTATALSMLEPAIIVVMGVVVATIVLAILLPILQLQSLIGG
ncbi:type II secretion system inner membrane protein GspF [Sphingomonas sp. LY29]|uniref:type II secretion system inner membrane protein GspF n=1 Tax=Sphingomonas sp. LY29 TaxID=3095341 RepID=UPI002D7A147A|nr:type II secretion system inner membrane protein GspF [Sphingomonas sp. LY29]WRP26829.1 type II secretion system inner membrane protein GspF [Sphingomonas sp. LY29]